MKKLIFLVFFFLICFSFNVQAQFETSKRKVSISVLPEKPSKRKAVLQNNNPSPTIPSAIKFESSYFQNKEDKFLDGLPAIPKVGEAQPKTYPLISPSDDYTQKFNQQLKEDGISPELYNRDVSLGSFIVYTQGITIGARDYGAIDGDLVRIWLNGELISNQIYLESNFKNIALQLKKGGNIIEIEALNYGELSPNTGQFNFFDDNKELITVQYWNLGIGYKARIAIEYRDKILKKIDEK
jgi:hypothetical protein